MPWFIHPRVLGIPTINFNKNSTLERGGKKEKNERKGGKIKKRKRKKKEGGGWV